MSATINHRAGRIGLLLSLGLTLLTTSARAQQSLPRLLSYQGVLADSRRTPVPDGQYTVTFRLYGAATGGVPLWEETNTVRTINGVFESVLGANTPLNVPFDRSYWVSLAVQGDVEMSPRVRLLATPYAIRSIVADTALHLAPGAPGVVRSINAIDGNVVLVGQGGASVRTSGDTVAIVVSNGLPTATTDGQTIRWNATTRTWEAVNPAVATRGRFTGNGTAAAPLDIARMGAMNGQALVWNDGAESWVPGSITVQTQAPLRGDGSAASPIGLTSATTTGALLYWDGTGWKAATPRAPIAGELLRWNATSKSWVPAGVVVSDDGDLGVGGDVRVGKNLIVNGTTVTLPAKSIDNDELASSTIHLTYGAGIVGDDSVALGGELALRNTGVTQLTGTPNQVIADTAHGSVNLSLPQDIHAGATPKFASVELSAVPSGSASDTFLVSNGGTVQSRTVGSLIPSFTAAFTPMYWGTSGNAGTTPGNNFVGTTDDQALELHVADSLSNGADGRGRVMRYEPNGTSANIIGGFSGNTVAAGVSGTTIAGGGSNTNINASSSSFTFIGGGNRNSISTGANHASIVGGNNNAIRPGAQRSVIGGGQNNIIDTNTTNAVIAGGARNRVAAVDAVISGGSDNAVNTGSTHSAIAGGSDNTIGTGSYESTMGAGNLNTIGNNSPRSTIGGGSNSTIEGSAPSATISGGYANSIRFSSEMATIGGGMANTIDSSADEATISGGKSNRIEDGGVASAIFGGSSNSIGRNAGGSMAGGTGNAIRSNASRSVISGGMNNVIDTGATFSVIGGGQYNVLGVNSGNSVIAGGRGLSINGTGSFGFLGGNNGGSRNMQVTANNTAVFGNTDLWLANNDNAPSQLRFYEAYNSSGAFPNTANYSSFNAQAQTADINYILPDTAGLAGDVLKVKTISGTTVTLDWAADNTGAPSWSLAGNSGTTPGTNFLGTRDNQAFEIHVADTVSGGAGGRGRVMRYEPNGTSANIIGGYRSNSVAAGVVGGTIAGGGSATDGANAINANHGTIGGGVNNVVGTSSVNSTIAGGQGNRVGSDGGALNGTVSGGLGNVITAGDHNTIAGGFANTVQTGSLAATISGGTHNTIAAGNGVITGGSNHVLNASHSVVGGGLSDTIQTGAGESVIAGGFQNVIRNNAVGSTISGGQENVVNANAVRTTIGGGYRNVVGAGTQNATIGGGYNNLIRSGDHATIGGGYFNLIETGSYGTTIAGGTDHIIRSIVGTIGGGEQNTIGASSANSTIAGGLGITIGAASMNSFIGGGEDNRIDSSASISTIAGGQNNVIGIGATEGTIGGGRNNIVNGARSAIAGGRGLTLNGAGSFGFLGGNTGANDMQIAASNVTVLGNTALWLANNNSTASQMRYYEPNGASGAFPGATNYTSFQAGTQTADINYVLPATIGGVGDQLTISAVAGTQATLAWALPSDRRIKTDFLTIDGETVLNRFRGLELGTWRYTHDADDRRHYGIMAQDFHRLFGSDGVGRIGTDTTVNNIDMMGVSYLAIQALEARTSQGQSAIDELMTMMKQQREEMHALREEVRLLREENSALREGVR